jgi:hypothetical protein
MNSDRPKGPAPGPSREGVSGEGVLRDNMFLDEKEFIDSLGWLDEERRQQVIESMRLARNPRRLNASERQILSETVAPLLRDLAATGMRLPDIRPEAHHVSGMEGVGAWIHEPDGCGSGIDIATDLPPAERVERLAEQIQNWAADQLHDAGRKPEWPLCPQHPACNRASPEVVDGSPVWVCGEGPHVISAIGSLPKSR